MIADEYQSTYIHKFLVNPLIYIGIVLSILAALFMISFALSKLIKIKFIDKVRIFFRNFIYLAIPIRLFMEIYLRVCLVSFIGMTMPGGILNFALCLISVLMMTVGVHIIFIKMGQRE